MIKRFQCVRRLLALRKAETRQCAPPSEIIFQGMRGSWYATKRLFASFATAIFRKICRGPHSQKHKYGMGASHRASQDKKYIES